MNTVHLFGETHENHEDRMKEFKLIRELSNNIGCLSIELPFEKYEHLINTYNPQEQSIVFGRNTTLIHLAKSKGLDVIASDYQNTLAGHLYKWIDKKVDELNEQYTGKPMSEKKIEELLNKKLKPLHWEKYSRANPIYESYHLPLKEAEDNFDFIAMWFQKERDDFAINRIRQYILEKEKNVLHIGGKKHIPALAEELKKEYEIVIY